MFAFRAAAPVWEGDGGGAGGAGEAGAGGEGAAGKGGAGGEGAAGKGGAAGGEWTPPEDLPEEFRGKDPVETLGKLFDGYKAANTRAEGLRTKIAHMPVMPKAPEEYVFAPSEKVKPYFPEGKGDHPLLAHARAAAFKAGIPRDAFGAFINSFYEGAIEGELLGAPFDERREVAVFKDALGLDDRAVGAALAETVGFAEGLFKQLQGIPEAHKTAVQAELMNLTDTAAGNMLLRAISQRLSASGIRIAGTGAAAAAGETWADYERIGGDPRIDPRNKNETDPDKRFDPELRRQWEELGRRLAGTQRPRQG